jgi:hypothetical protein
MCQQSAVQNARPGWPGAESNTSLASQVKLVRWWGRRYGLHACVKAGRQWGRLASMIDVAKHLLVIVGIAWVFVITLLVILYTAGWRFKNS